MSRQVRLPAVAAVLFVCLLAVASVSTSGAATALGATSVSPTSVSTGETTTLSVSVNATGVNTSDGTTGGNVTVSAPAALDLSGATVDSEAVTPNATGVQASVDSAANAVVVSWDDDGGVDSETVEATVTLTGVDVGRTGDHDLTAAVDADGDGTSDAQGPVGTVTATATGSDRSVTTTGSVLYLGEEDVDLTGLAGAASAGESQQFTGVGGEAEGRAAAAADAVAVDVTAGNGFTTGTYSLDSAGDADLVVERPRVTDVRLYPGESASGTDVSGSSVPTSVGSLTVDPRFNFEAADDATVVVENADGLDVTGELTADPTVATADETVTLDVSGLDVGTYTVRVEGADDLDHVTGTATVRVRDEARVVSVSRTRVVRGESTVATVSGAPGAVRYVRLPGAVLRDGESVTVPTAKAVFGAADGLVLVGADSAEDALYAVVALDDDGFAKVELRTERLDAGTHEVEVATDVPADAEASVPFTVVDRDVSATLDRANATVGETVTVSGTARGADDVKLYARVGGEYAPLYRDASTGDLAETRVENDGSWEVDLDTTAVVDVVGEYRIAAVADPGDASLGSSGRISEETLRGFDAVDTATLRTTDPSPSASVSRTHVATTPADEVRVTGRAPGPGETVRAYVVSPRGAVSPLDETVADDDSFDFEYDAFGESGTYRLLVVTPGRDAAFASADGGDASSVTSELSGSETPEQAVAILRDAYGGAGVDDGLVSLTVTATDPRVTVETVTESDDGALVVSGSSNRESGTLVLLDLRDGERLVAADDAEVNASGRFRATLDASGLAPGAYELRAEVGDVTDTRTVRLGAEEAPTAAPTESAAEAASVDVTTATPTETTRTPTATVTTTAPAETAAAAVDGTRAAAAGERRTETTGDGFGVATAFATALVALTAVAGWHRRRR